MSDTATEESEPEVSTTASGDVSLRLENVTKLFEEADGSKVVAVDDISFEIYDGEFIVLVGPSGCGKTTTLRMIAGLEAPTEGKIFIEGEDVSGQDPRERDIAMVFQNYALYPHKTVRQNIAFPLQIRKYPKDEIGTRVQETAELLDIPDLLDRHPSDLSGGQQQRVAVARALVANPKLILADEPTGNLDSAHGEEVMNLLKELNDEGTTIVMVTHSPSDAEYARRIVHLFDGQIVSENVTKLL